MAEPTVRLELEYGDVEFEFEGPADFARNDLLPLLDGLIAKLSEVGIEIDMDDLDEDDDDEDEEGEPEEAKPRKPGAGKRGDA